jgi:ribonucleoside-diphosphate reductase alpha chain
VGATSGTAAVVSIAKTRDQGVISNDAGHWPRVFTTEGVHPFDVIEWKAAEAEIRNEKNEIVFQQKNIEVPAWWSQNTINVVVSKYFRKIDGVKESSAKQMFSRVVNAIRTQAAQQGYFNTDQDAQIFGDELLFALIHQYGAFNSPVWFNLGVPNRKQAISACFISSVEDSLDGIMAYQRSEIDIFRGGSGSGANLSTIRSSYEKISAGSYTSGVISWMEATDKYAGAMKSGGATRNAAKMNVLDMDHPDILETRDGRPGFIRCKAEEEVLAHKLVDIGLNADYDDPNGAYKRVRFQNANNSVSIPDSFMQAMMDDGTWTTKDRKEGNVVHTYKARDLWIEIANAAWTCGDPGVQFTDTINKWHTTPKTGRIRSSNPCSEFLHVDNTACNLCAINLTKFFNGRVFDYGRFAQTVRVFSTSQMAMIENAAYPTESITQNSKKLRPIGTNYGNLGALLMKLGYGYDSDEGRAVAARMASLMTGLVYLNAAKTAARVGAFAEFENNREDMFRVMKMHQEADAGILKRWNQSTEVLGEDVLSKSAEIWKEAIALGEKFGYNVSQASLQAPLGTISFLMGMSTTGIEPAFALVSHKKLVGGGSMKIINSGVRDALTHLGYSTDDIDNICKYIEENGTIEGAPGLNEKHLSVFDCAMAARDGGRCLTPMSHIKMMSAIQPLITCAISKTVNLPKSVTSEEIAGIYQETWRLGLKCVALYRDGCKASQPLSTKESPKLQVVKAQPAIVPLPAPAPLPAPTPIRAAVPQTRVPAYREKMPPDVDGWRHKFTIDGYKGYIIVMEYPDGRPGEVFLKLGKPGSTVAGLIDGFTQLLSIGLQYGLPLPKLINSFIDTRFEPAGMTGNKEIKFAKSLYDYLFKVLDVHYFDGEHSGLSERLEKIRGYKDLQAGMSKEIDSSIVPLPISIEPEPEEQVHVSRNLDAPPCIHCGAITQRNGSCYMCPSCGSSTGCS